MTLLIALLKSVRVIGGSRLESPHRADSATVARSISFFRAVSRFFASAGVRAPPGLTMNFCTWSATRSLKLGSDQSRWKKYCGLLLASDQLFWFAASGQ